MEAAKKFSEENREKLAAESEKITGTYDKLMTDQALKGEAQRRILNSTQSQITQFINQYASDYEMLGTTLGESLYSGISKKVKNITGYVDRIAAASDTQTEKTLAAGKLESYVKNSKNRKSAIENINSLMNSFTASLDGIAVKAARYKNRLAVVANDAAEKYYQTNNTVYHNQNNSVIRPIDINTTVNFNDKVDSPVEVKRQIEYFSQQLAKEIQEI